MYELVKIRVLCSFVLQIQTHTQSNGPFLFLINLSSFSLTFSGVAIRKQNPDITAELLILSAQQFSF